MNGFWGSNPEEEEEVIGRWCCWLVLVERKKGY